MTEASNYEYDILALLWTLGKGLTAAEISRLAEESGNKGWKSTSIHPLLANMMEKNLIHVDGVVLAGRHYSRVFHPSVSAEEYSVEQVVKNLQSSQNRQVSLQSIVASLLDHEEVSLDTIKGIEALLKEKRRES